MDSDSINFTEVVNYTNSLERFKIYSIADYINVYYIWVILAVGVPGNIASIITILRMPPLTSSTAYVAVLAAGDSVAILIKLLYHQLTLYNVNIGAWGCRVLFYLGTFSTMYVNWILVAMTVERFIAIWFPLKVINYCNWNNASFVMIGVAVILLLADMQFLWSQTIYNENGRVICRPESEYETFFDLYWYWIDGALYAFLPCILLFVFNFLIIFGIRKSGRIQESLTNNKSRHTSESMRQQRQITIMLVVVSIVFVILILPNCILFIVKSYLTYQKNSYDHAKFVMTNQLIFVLSDSNHAVNFYLYFLSGKKFRKRFVDTFFCRQTVRRPSTEFRRSLNHESTSTSTTPLTRYETSFR